MRAVVPIAFHGVSTGSESAVVHARVLRNCTPWAVIAVVGLPGLALDLARQLAADLSEDHHLAEVELQ